MKKLIIVGRLELIEPLGILHLLGSARNVGWDCRVVLIKDGNFAPLHKLAESFQPDLIGFSVWTGWRLPIFSAADRLRAQGFNIVIGGPHATYATDRCLEHGDWVVKGDGFRSFRLILEAIAGERQLATGLLHGGGIEDTKEVVLSANMLFDSKRMAEGFPTPDRKLVYDQYPSLAQSPIKSIMCSEGCPFTCSYCYAPHFNEMYGGFELTMRSVDNVIAEARWIRDHYPLQLIYMQDDIFGYKIPWLEEFTHRWPQEIGIPFHCQIRLELTRNTRRLELLRQAGCTGVTLAIEHGSEWMRRFVLDRHMTPEDIGSGMEKLRMLGFTVRTEQIYGVPFSTLHSDLETLEMNAAFPGLTMFWCSILAPYLGTLMGNIASRMGFYPFNNDDLSENFFERSVMTYNEDGRAPLEGAILRLARNEKDNPLGRLHAEKNGDRLADIFHADNPTSIGQIRYLDSCENDRYRDQMVMLQRLSNFFVRVPNGPKLARKFAESSPAIGLGSAWGR